MRVIVVRGLVNQYRPTRSLGRQGIHVSRSADYLRIGSHPAGQGVTAGCRTFLPAPSHGTYVLLLPDPPRDRGEVREHQQEEEFTAMKALIRNLVVREEGQDLVEYALLAALLSIVSIAALTTLGPVIANVWQRIEAAINV